ncbi:hypothetical protein SAMN06264849_103263 [Melghirimyces algeriensis]|uniref:Uncharacterized protein n=1 Tax=Melghirimyces algeriensis TaxID=910412 RepID=A0A521CC36_9BACL|nr:hypothetical protein SAMN06264849_103263 [Melghirimyces algeriensis]
MTTLERELFGSLIFLNVEDKSQSIRLVTYLKISEFIDDHYMIYLFDAQIFLFRWTSCAIS